MSPPIQVSNTSCLPAIFELSRPVFHRPHTALALIQPRKLLVCRDNHEASGDVSAMTAVKDPFHVASCCAVFHQPPSASSVSEFLESFTVIHAATVPTAKVQEYPDGSFHNYFSLGVSLFYSSSNRNVKPRLLERIDIYNPPAVSAPDAPTTSARRRGARPPWAGYSPPRFPIVFDFPSTTLSIPPAKAGDPPREIVRSAKLSIDSHTKAKDVVAHLGEPTKKGGQIGWVPLFLEWASVELQTPDGRTVTLGVMTELREPGPEGLEALSEEVKKKGFGGVWDQASEWEWAGLKLFPAA